jgi:hypothetical protein
MLLNTYRIRARWIIGLAFLWLWPAIAGQTATQVSPRDSRHLEGEAALDQVLRENALFFNILVSFAISASEADPVWGVNVKDINLILLYR